MYGAGNNPDIFTRLANEQQLLTRETGILPRTVRMLLLGSCWLLVIAAAFGQLTQRTVQMNANAEALAGKWYPHSRALIIGEDDYQFQRPLNYAVSDARSLARELESDYGFAHSDVEVLENPDRKAIKDALHGLTDPKTVGPDDRLVVYFSGHGATVRSTPNSVAMGFLLPQDAQVEKAGDSSYLFTWIPMSDVWSELDHCPAKHLLVLVDACFSGLMVDLNREAYTSRALGSLLGKQAREVISAGTSSQTVGESADIGHGWFTYHLVAELKTRAMRHEAFAISDIFPDIRKNVMGSTGGQQVPLFGTRPNADGDVVFASRHSAFLATLGGIHFEMVDEDSPISVPLSVDNEDVRKVISDLFKSMQLDVHLDPQVQGYVSVYLSANSTLRTALLTILRQVGATYTVNGGVYEIVPAPTHP